MADSPLHEVKDTFLAVVGAIDELETDPSRHLSLQIDDRLRAAIVAARAANKASKITIEVKVEPGPERRMIFSGAVKASLPSPPTNSVVLYADEKGEVHHQDPAQLNLPGVKRLPVAAVPDLPSNKGE